MSLWRELLEWLGLRLGQRWGEVEDPGDALDLAHARQVELQLKMRRAVADVVTARKRLELQARQLEPAVGRLEEQARAALEEGRQAAARDLAARQVVLRGELDGLREHHAAVVADEARLLEAARRLDLQVQQFRVRREAMKASYAAARARDRIGRALAADPIQRELARYARTQEEVDAELNRLDGELLWGPSALEDPKREGTT